MAMPQRDDLPSRCAFPPSRCALRRTRRRTGTIEAIKRLDLLLEYAVMHGDEEEAERIRADRSRGRRVVQDCDPKTYMYMASGRKDAQIARPAQGARLPRP